MYKLLLLLPIFLFLNGCAQQSQGLSPAPYSLEYLDAKYHLNKQSEN